MNKHTGFGLAYVKKEGCAMHPDDIDVELSEQEYIKQANAYINDTGDKNACFARDELRISSIQSDELKGIL